MYVLISRVTDPRLLTLLGVPPIDLVDDICRAVYAAGFDVDEFWRRAVSVTNEWRYEPHHPRFVNRIQQRNFTEKSVPLKWRALSECLDPQPQALEVIKALLGYIDRCDAAANAGAPKPPFCTADGAAIFPEEGVKWWMTELSLRKEQQAAGDEDGPAASEAEAEEECDGQDSDIIHPELPLEASSSDEDGPMPAAEPLEVSASQRDPKFCFPDE